MLSILFFLATVSCSNHVHQIEGKNVTQLFKRADTCSFPTDKGLVAVQTKGQNAGWAMHSDQECTYGSWCPYACPPGQLMGQWDTSVTSYSYPSSQNGGLYCNSNGELELKNSNEKYCYDGKGTLIANNLCSKNIAICQTVLPGNEEMLIPNNVDSSSKLTLAVPGTDYFISSAAHYYVNPPGVSIDDGCKWGSKANPYGNWSPYVAGANQDSNENTYIKIGWNPIYLDDFGSVLPSFGIRITCADSTKCNGLPCEIDPSKNGINGINGNSATGAGNGNFCVVTAEKGSTGNIEIFELSSSKAKRDHAHAHHKNSALTKTTTILKTVINQ